MAAIGKIFECHQRHAVIVVVAAAKQASDLLQAVVDNPLVGTSLIAGYGPSGDTERPGFDWFFGRDALWSSLALDAEGDPGDDKAAERADGGSA